ncbi:anaphase-promoting complex subunit 5-domain-containing protein [Limtongia smithiae]|uniref:anaphase-promoting complex subunit 5-domain-containing protein n=1 Tax=Limtongia smithiae TaxID=1125753 RepID=UPI0034CE0287
MNRAVHTPATGVSSGFLTPPVIGLMCLIHIYQNLGIKVEDRIQIMMLIHHWIDDNDTCMFLLTLEDFRKKLQGLHCLEDEPVYHCMVIHMFYIANLDDFYAHFDDMDAEFFGIEMDGDEPIIDPTSIVGYFLRRCYIEFRDMDFQSRRTLWNGFKKFRLSGQAELSLDMEFAMDETQIEPVDDESAKDIASVEDLSKIFEFQIKYMQKHGCKLPEDMLVTLNKMLEYTVKTPSSVYYIRFLHGWRSGDFQESFENLHRYFDYTMYNNDKSFYQYALLNLAILQADFNCPQEAMCAIEETIKAARESKDNVCLNFALSWLYHYHKAHPEYGLLKGTSQDTTIQFLKVKAKETGMVNLQSILYLTEAKSLLSSGGSATLVLEALVKSMHINTSVNLIESAGSQFLVQSVFWTRLGISTLSKFYNVAYSDIFDSQDLFLEDKVKLGCRLSLSILQAGYYDIALSMIDGMESVATESQRVQDIWKSFKLLILFRRAIRNERFKQAEYLSAQLDTMVDTVEECTLEIKLAKIDYLAASGNLEEAMTIASSSLNAAVSDGTDIFQQTSYQLAYCRLLNLCGRSRRGYSMILSCIAAAESAGVVPAVIRAILELCSLFNKAAKYQVVLSILDDLMPYALESDDIDIVAMSNYEAAKAIIGAHQLDIASTATNLAQEIQQAIKYCGLALSAYQQMEDLAMCMKLTSLQARLYHCLGDEFHADRDACANAFLQLSNKSRASRLECAIDDFL